MPTSCPEGATAIRFRKFWFADVLAAAINEKSGRIFIANPTAPGPTERTAWPGPLSKSTVPWMLPAAKTDPSGPTAMSCRKAAELSSMFTTVLLATRLPPASSRKMNMPHGHDADVPVHGVSVSPPISKLPSGASRTFGIARSVHAGPSCAAVETQRTLPSPARRTRLLSHPRKTIPPSAVAAALGTPYGLVQPHPAQGAVHTGSPAGSSFVTEAAPAMKTAPSLALQLVDIALDSLPSSVRTHSRVPSARVRQSSVAAPSTMPARTSPAPRGSMSIVPEKVSPK